MSPKPAQIVLASAVRKRGKKLWAVTFAGTARLATQPGGGEPGLASGFGHVVLARLRAPHVGLAMLFGRFDTPSMTYPPPAGTKGWMILAGPGATGLGNRTAGLVDGAGAFQYGVPWGAGLQITDVGKLFVILTQYTGAQQRMIVEREFMPTVATTGLVVSPEATVLGNDAVGSEPSQFFDILEAATWGGTPSDANLIALVDAIRTQAKIPASPTGITLRHRWSATEAVGGAVVSSGSPAPALPDLVTGLAIDTMAPVGGSPTLQEVDLVSKEGLVTYGYTGFSLLSHLTVANGITGSVAGGMHAILVITPGGTILTGTHMIVHCVKTTAPFGGWYVSTDSGVLRFVVFTTTSAEFSVTYTLSATDLHRPLWFAVQITSAGMVQLFVRGVKVGADVQLTGAFFPAVGFPTRIGIYHSGNPLSADMVFWGLASGGEVSLSELAQAYAAYEKTGIVQAVPGKAERLYQPTTDIAAAGGRFSALAQVLDRIGTNHLARTGGPVIDTANGNGLRGLGTDYTYVQRGSPIAARTAGLFVEVIVYARSGVSLSKICGTNEQANSGWTLHMYEGNIQLKYARPTGAANTVTYPISMNAWHHLAFRVDESAYHRFFVDGVSKGNLGSNYIVADPTGMFSIFAAEPLTINGVAVAFSPSLPTDAEIATSATYALANKKLQVIAGKTAHLWSPPDDYAVDRNVISLFDRAGLYQNLPLTNPPLQVATRKERSWSYDTAPTAYGIRGLSDTAYYEFLYPILPGHAGGFWVTLSFSVDDPNAAVNRVLASCQNWDMRLTNNGAYAYFNIFDASSTFRASPVAAFAPKDVGKIQTITGVFDAPALKVRLYHRRAEVGAGLATGAGLIAPGNFYLGRSAVAGNASPGVTIYGLAYGHGVPAPHLIAAHHDLAVANDGRLSTIQWMTARLYDPTLDAIAGGGTVGASILDRTWGHHLNRVGAPTTYARYSRTQGV